MRSYTVPLSLLGAVLAAAGAGAWFLGDGTGYAGMANVAVGLALVGLAGAANPSLLQRYGRWLNAFWGSLMVLGIVGMVVFLAGRYPRRLDLTEGKLHSLADLTVSTVAGLDRDLTVTAYVDGGVNPELKALLDEYRVHSPHFRYELVDPDRDPDRAQVPAAQRYNTVVVACGDRQQQVTDLSEKEITNAILKVTRDRQDRVYFTMGHGEASLGEAPGGLSVLASRLKDVSYGLDTVFVARVGEIPADCAVLVIAGPRTPFLAPEVDAVRRYLERGGAVFAMLDPLYDSGLSPLLSAWGVKVGDDFVIDTSGIGSLFGLDFTTPVAVSYGDHPITRRHQGVMTFFRLARSVDVDSARVGDRQAAPLVWTSDQGWAERDLSVLQEGATNRTVKMDPGVDRPGPVPLAVAVTGAAPAASGRAPRLVVFGDSDLGTNQLFTYQGNGDLVLNAISWLAEDEGLISIRPREPGYNPISLTESQSNWVFWITVVLLPVAVAGLGISVVSRQGRWRPVDLATAGLGIAAALVAVGMVNVVGDRWHHRFDTTRDKLFTLSPATAALLAPLGERDQTVRVKSFLRPMDPQRLRDLLTEYKSLSNRFDFEIVDPDRNALQAKQAGVREPGTSLIEVTTGGKVRTERTTEMTEQGLSNAIRRALRTGEQQAWFIGGHGEASVDQVDGAGFSIFKGRLREQNLEVKADQTLSGEVPDEVSLIVILSPKKPLAPAEVETLRRFVNRGRSLLLLLDPGAPTGLESFLASQGITVGQDFIVDLSGLGQLLGADVSVPVVLQYGDHPATARMNRGTMSFFPMARSITPVDGSPGEVKSLALTHRSSWAETDLAALNNAVGAKVQFDPGVDRRGPVSLAVAAKVDADTGSGPPAKSRLVVFGDADFGSNQYIGQQANGELLTGAVNWLTEGDDALTIEDHEPAFNPINLIGNQGVVILWVSVFVLPLAVALLGLVMVLKRGYESYVDGITSWLAYTFAANGVFFLASGVIDLSGTGWVGGQAKLTMAILLGVVAYGVFLRARWAWGPAAVVALASAVAGFYVIPGDTVMSFYLQLAYAAVFAINAAMLMWVRQGFAREVAAR